MKLRIHHYVCLAAAIAILFPCKADAAIWAFTSVRSYGAYGDGLHDDTAAINSAIAGGTVGDKAMVYFPPGKYKYTGPMALPANTSFRIYGDGPGVSTILFFDNNNHNAGITVTHTGIASLNIEGLTLMAGSTNCGTALNASFYPGTPTVPPSTTKFRTAAIHNVQIIGTTRDGVTGGYWTNGIHLYRASNAVVDKVHISGNKNMTQTGIIWDSSTNENTTGVQMTNLEVKWCNTALATSGLVEGLYATQFEFTSCGTISTPAVNLSGLGSSAFHLVNGQVDAVGNGVAMNSLIFAKVSNVYFRHNGPDATLGTMLSVNGVEDLVVSECTFYGVDPVPVVSDENGIFLTASHSVRITGNSFSNMRPNNGSCIVIWNDSSVVRITDNLFSSTVRQRFNDMTADPNDPYYCGNSPTNNCGSTP